VLDLGDLTRQGAALVEQAQRRAEQVLAEARVERDRIVAGAKEKGFAQGHAEGLAKGTREGIEQGRAAAVAEYKKKLDELSASWGAAVDGFERTREELLTRTQVDVLRLALLIAAKVTKRVVATDPMVAVEQSRAVLETVVRPTALVLAVNPADRPTIERALPELVKRLPLVRHVELQEDAGVSAGSVVARGRGSQAPDGINGGSGCGVAIGGGEIDASIETQLQRIVEVLVPGLEDRPENDAGGPIAAAWGAGGDR
jgi:flagellar biosynthesis/type III secretory pathway protein FliH